MSNISKRRREGSRAKIKSMGDHKDFLRRITKTLYYGQLPPLPCLSLPLTEISCEEWSMSQRGRSLRRLHADAAAGIARQACVSPAALVLAVLYLERLRASRPDYLVHTPPTELFLVSLMVGNKFLQDDGEDEEVICSEWAASGGLDLAHLKKLELEFLSAMEWNVFVSDQSFEMGLRWLERRVAMRQAQLRGFFTYTDLEASVDCALVAEVVRAVAAVCAAATLTYVAGLLALVASSLFLSQTCLPQLQRLVTPSRVDTTTATHGFSSQISTGPVYIPNSTDDMLPVDELIQDYTTDMNTRKCCTDWLRYQDSAPRKTWYETVIVNDWKTFETWWSRTSVLNWLYQSSLVNPMQRWLEKINQYAERLRKELYMELPVFRGKCEVYDTVKHVGPQRCVRQWLNLSKLGVFVTSVSDR